MSTCPGLSFRFHDHVKHINHIPLKASGPMPSVHRGLSHLPGHVTSWKHPVDLYPEILTQSSPLTHTRAPQKSMEFSPVGWFCWAQQLHTPGTRPQPVMSELPVAAISHPTPCPALGLRNMSSFCAEAYRQALSRIRPWLLNVCNWGSQQLLSSAHRLQTRISVVMLSHPTTMEVCVLRFDRDQQVGADHQTSQFHGHKTGNRLANLVSSSLQNCSKSKPCESQLR